VIEMQRARPSQTLRQTARGCSAMLAVASGVVWCCWRRLWLLNQYIYAPDIAPDSETPERSSFEEVLLSEQN
jgi:hypothetical protein